MGRNVRQQWYGGSEGNLWDSLQSPPGLRGWEGLWDSNGMMGLRGVPGTPFSPRQDSGDKKLARTVGQQWYGGTEESPWDSLQSLPGLRG